MLLPFIVFLAIVYFSMGWLITNAAGRCGELSPLLKMIKPCGPIPDRPAPPTLIIFVVSALPDVLLRTCLGCSCAGIQSAEPLACILRPVAIATFVPARAGSAYGFGSCAPPGTRRSVSAVVGAGFYGVYFALGFQLFHRAGLLDRVKPAMPFLLLAALIAYSAFLVLLLRSLVANPDPLLHVLKAMLEAYAGFWMTLVCLIYGKQWLDRSNRVMRYIADASYWVYIVHLPVLFAIQYPFAGYPKRIRVLKLETCCVFSAGDFVCELSRAGSQYPPGNS